MDRLLRAWIIGWPLLGLATVAVAHGNRPVLWLTSFFTVALLWPATLAAARLAGAGAGAAGGAVCCALLATHLMGLPPAPAIQPPQLERRFQGQGDAVRHTIVVPTQSAEWRRLWAQETRLEAYLYIRVAHQLDLADPLLVVRVRGRETSYLSAQTRAAGIGRSETERDDWHRLRIDRTALEEATPLVVEVAPPTDRALGSGTIAVFGGYSLRATPSHAASAYFDGSRWTDDPAAIFPELDQWQAPAGQTLRARLFIELRLVDPETRRFVALYY